MDEWNRLSIVDKTALMVAYGQSFHCAKGDLDGALVLFRAIKHDQMWHERNLENNYRPIKEQLNQEISALLQGLTPAELLARNIAREQKSKERASARRQMFKV